MTALISLTPREYVRQIERLVASGDDQGALTCSARHRQQVAPTLTNPALLHIAGPLERAAMAPAPANGAGMVDDVPAESNGAAVAATTRAGAVRHAAVTRYARGRRLRT